MAKSPPRPPNDVDKRFSLLDLRDDPPVKQPPPPTPVSILTAAAPGTLEVKTITFERLVKVAAYENERAGVTIAISNADDVNAAFDRAREIVYAALKLDAKGQRPRTPAEQAARAARTAAAQRGRAPGRQGRDRAFLDFMEATDMALDGDDD
jgi:hypothetical protein